MDAPAEINSLFKVKPDQISYGTPDHFDRDWYSLEVEEGVSYEAYLTSNSELYGWNSNNNGEAFQFNILDGSLVMFMRIQILYLVTTQYGQEKTTQYLRQMNLVHIM